MTYSSKQERKREERPAYVPVVGHVYNPLLKFPRNHSCFCGSGDKFKECCLKYQPNAIPKDWGERIKQCWNRLLSGELRIVPPKRAAEIEAELENPPAPMPEVPLEEPNGPDTNAVPDVPVVPAGQEPVLVRTTEDGKEPRDGRSEGARVGENEGI